MLDLKGTEAQVKWATKIRAAALPLFREAIAMLDPMSNDMDSINALAQRIELHSDSLFWIDKREYFSCTDRIAFYLRFRSKEIREKHLGKK